MEVVCLPGPALLFFSFRFEYIWFYRDFPENGPLVDLANSYSESSGSQPAQYVSNEYINIHLDKIGWVLETPMN